MERRTLFFRYALTPGIPLEAGRLEVLAYIPGRPSGLGFIGDDTLLVASQQDRSVYRVDFATAGAEVRLHADLSNIASWHLNDMVTDADGNAYVGNFGSGAAPEEQIAPAALALVRTDGSSDVVAEQLWFPNGMAVSADGETLYVAETRSEPGRLTAFDIARDATLANRRVVIEFEAEWPDGIAIDRNGDLWVASPFSNEIIKVSPEGEITERLSVPSPYAVAIGGKAGTDLFVASANTWVPERAAVARAGRVLLVEGVVA